MEKKKFWLRVVNFGGIISFVLAIILMILYLFFPVTIIEILGTIFTSLAGLGCICSVIFTMTKK